MCAYVFCSCDIPYLFLSLCASVQLCVCMCACVWLFLCLNERMFFCVSVCVYVCMCVCRQPCVCTCVACVCMCVSHMQKNTLGTHSSLTSGECRASLCIRNTLGTHASGSHCRRNTVERDSMYQEHIEICCVLNSDESNRKVAETRASRDTSGCSCRCHQI